VSCGETRKPVYPTRGKVVDKSGAPAAGVLVIFTPLDETDPAKWPQGFPRATTEKDGAFVLTTYDAGDGIPAGQYAVTMLWQTPDPQDEERDNPDKFGGRYADPKNPVRKVTIQVGDNELPPIRVP
jgi:hypothetical protein